MRRRNFVKPAQIPYAAANGLTYDSGDFQGVFNDALKLSDHAGFAKRKKESRKRGKLENDLFLRTFAQEHLGMMDVEELSEFDKVRACVSFETSGRTRLYS